MDRKLELKKIQRVVKLEKAIVTAINKYGISLKCGSYISKGISGDACGCAIGTAIMATAKTRPQLNQIIQEYMYMSSYCAGEAAMKIVNDGLTESDLRNLEVGFEDWTMDNSKYCGVFFNLPFNKKNPFYKLGMKLRKLSEKQ